jgi:hypothetical protein
VTNTLDRKILSEEGFLFLMISKVLVHHGREGMAKQTAHIMVDRKPSGPQPVGWYCPHSGKTELLPLGNSLWKRPHRYSQMCVLPMF